MEITIADWAFQVDAAATFRATTQYSLDHCTCGYCKNYYEAAPLTYPELVEFLSQFGVEFHGPIEVMPYLPTCILSCYRVQGQITKFGSQPIFAGEVMITPEAENESSFFLWAGEMMLPWLQQEPEEDVVSPANLPEFMDRMEEVWLLRHGPESIMS